jgi:MFS family permease
MARRPLQYLTIFLTCFVDILGFGIVIPVLPLYAEHFGATAVQIGWLVGIFSLAQFFFAPIWGKVSDRLGRKPVLLLGLFGTVIGYALMGLATSDGTPRCRLWAWIRLRASAWRLGERGIQLRGSNVFRGRTCPGEFLFRVGLSA